MMKLVKLNILRVFSIDAVGNEVSFMNLIIEKDAVAYIKKHNKDSAVTLYIHAAGGG